MSKWKVLRGRGNGRSYRRLKENGKYEMVAHDLIPSGVMERLKELEFGEVYDDSPEPAAQEERPKRLCVFCGRPGDYSRTVYLQIVYLCDQHYHNKTIGEVGAKVKEVGYGRQQKPQNETKEKENALLN